MSQNVSPLDSIFKAKEMVKAKKALEVSNQNKMPGMDVENNNQNKSNLSTTMNTKAPNASALSKKEETSQQNINKIIQKVANKGNPSIDLTETDLLRDILFAF